MPKNESPTINFVIKISFRGRIWKNIFKFEDPRYKNEASRSISLT